MALTETQVEAKAKEDYERVRREGGSALTSWANLPEETKEGYRQAYRAPATAVAGTPSRVYIGETRPTAPDKPALWIPLDASGNPLALGSWQVFA